VTVHAQDIVVVSHYGCGGVMAAMDMAKSRTNGHANPSPPSAPLPGADDDTGSGAIERWLAPTRALAVAQLRAAGPSSDLEEEESIRQLVRTHCCAQVSNIESSAIVQRAIREGKNITVYGWCVRSALRIGPGSPCWQGLRCRDGCGVELRPSERWTDDSRAGKLVDLNV
jgi:carbonic anhydrase